MQIAVFTIPINDDGSALEACNKLLRTVKLLNMERQFIANGADSSWSILVEYLPHARSEAGKRKAKVDYRELLNDVDFQLFSRLRTARKRLAQRDGVPVYAVFTNEQLAAIAVKNMTTVAELQQLEGVSENRAAKYAEILEEISQPSSP